MILRGLSFSCGDGAPLEASSVMTYYIAFRLTREGTVLDANEMYCDEAEAIERARALAVDFPVELWRGPLRITRYEPRLEP